MGLQHATAAHEWVVRPGGDNQCVLTHTVNLRTSGTVTKEESKAHVFQRKEGRYSTGPVKQGLINPIDGYIEHNRILYVVCGDRIYRLLPNTCSLKGHTPAMVLRTLQTMHVPPYLLR